MPSTGPYNEVIDRADLETAGHPFHISFMAALIQAWIGGQWCPASQPSPGGIRLKEKKRTKINKRVYIYIKFESNSKSLRPSNFRRRDDEVGAKFCVYETTIRRKGVWKSGFQ